MFFDDEYEKIKKYRDSLKIPTAHSVRKPREADTIHAVEPLTYPEGLLGEVAKYIHDSSPRPVTDIAIVGAVGLLAGICGKGYNISGTGLNQYLLMLAQTGTGKESMASGIDKLIHEMIQQVPSAIHHVGPAEIASGQALLRYIATHVPCFVSIVGEFGLKLQQITSPKASPSEIMLKRVLLDLYNKSGHNKVLRASVYADKDKNTESIQSPAFTLLGESTPESFYSALTQELISDGLLTRFTIVEYRGERPPLNKAHEGHRPPISLMEQLWQLSAMCMQLMHNNTVVDIKCKTSDLI